MKGVRDNPKDYGFADYHDWELWCKEELDMTRSNANRLIQAHEQFGTTSCRISSAKIFEMLSLPAEVDRQQFVEQSHTITSTQETKTVDEMTVRELREVKKALKEAEAKAQRAESDAEVARRDAEIKARQLARAYLLKVSEKVSGTLFVAKWRTSHLYKSFYVKRNEWTSPQTTPASDIT